MDTTKPFAVVTGASSGIGFELARQFATNNYNLLIAAEDAEAANASKSFVQSFALALRNEVKDTNVTIACSRSASSGAESDARRRAR